MKLKLSLTTAEAQRLWECYLEGRDMVGTDSADVSLHRKMQQMSRDAEDEPETDPENIYNLPGIRQSIEEDRK